MWHQICQSIGCHMFSTKEKLNPETMEIEKGCSLDFFRETKSYLVTEEPGMAFDVRGSVGDCTPTSNCNPQLAACGGTLPNFNLSKPLSLIQAFIRKEYKINDFFYNEAEKTFMNG